LKSELSHQIIRASQRTKTKKKTNKQKTPQSLVAQTMNAPKKKKIKIKIKEKRRTKDSTET
jgi:hypothetical protein